MSRTRPRSSISSARALGRALREAPALRAGARATVLLATLGSGGQVVVPIVLQQVIDHQILATDRIDLVRVAALGAGAFAALVVAALANRSAHARMSRAAAAGLCQLRVKAFAHMHDMSILHTEGERRGALVARVTSDVQEIQQFMQWGGVNLLVGSIRITLTMLAMLVYRWQLALLVVVTTAGYAVVLLWFQGILRRAYDRVRQRVSDSMAAVGEAISGLPTVRAYGAEGHTRRRVHERLRAQFRAEFGTHAVGALLFSSAEVFAAAITGGVILVGVLGIDGLSAGTLVAFLFLVNLFVEPVQTLVETLDQAQTAAAGVRRILRVLDTPVDITDPGRGRALPPGALPVEVRHLHFAYQPEREVLTGISVDIGAGRRIAVVGETGSGKTTFAKLLVRLLDPTAGEIRIGGVPLRGVRFASLRSRVVFVPQEGFLFNASVGDNVRYGRPDATDDAMHRAFAELKLDDWLGSLPKGLQTPVGQRGERLSAGERQLVAIVRAWIAGPDLLVLDEATSAVDPALDVQLRRAIERAITGRTSITIAHRLATAEVADEILVFERGRLVEHGTHAQLVAGGGTYAGLHADWATGTSATSQPKP